MLRALIVSVLMLALAGRAEAAAVLGGDRDAWLRGFDGGAETRVQVTAWTAGVNETLFLVVHTLGCKSQEPVSGYTLAGATADLRRQNKIEQPIFAAIQAYGKLSGCNDVINWWLKKPPGRQP